MIWLVICAFGGGTKHVEPPGADAVTLTANGDDVKARACVLACGASYMLQRRLGAAPVDAGHAV